MPESVPAPVHEWENDLLAPVIDRSAYFAILVDGVPVAHELTEERAWEVAQDRASYLAATERRLSLPNRGQVAIQYPADVDRVDLASGTFPMFGRNTLDVTPAPPYATPAPGPWHVGDWHPGYVVQPSAHGAFDSQWTTAEVAQSRADYLNEGGTLDPVAWRAWTGA